MHRLSARILVLLVTGLPLLVRPATPQVTSASIEVSIVNVDVIVTDEHGNRVTGLKKDDFEIRENGELQPVTHFAVYQDEHARPAVLPPTAVAAAPAATAAPAQEPSPAASNVQKRAIVLFVERTRFVRPRSQQFFGEIRQLLHRTMRPNDVATIVTWEKGLMLVRQPATGDLAALDRVIDRMTFEWESPLINPYQAEIADAALTEKYLAEANEFFAKNGGEKNDSIIDQTVWEKKIVADTAAKLRSVAALTRSMADLDARKILILATRRIQVLGAGHDRKRNSRILAGLMADLSSAANANGVTIYALVAEDTLFAPDVTGDGRRPSSMAGSDGPPAAAPLNVEELGLLEDVARATGGTTSSNAIETAARLPSVADDLQSYYSLAYRATGRKGPLRIEVTTKNPRLRVRSRTSYVVKSDETRMEDRVIGSLFGQPPRAMFPITAELSKQSAARDVGRKMEVRIPIRALTPFPERGGYTFTFTVYISAAGLRGVSDPFRETKSFHVPASKLEGARTAFYTYEVQLVADETTRRVSIGILDEGSKDYGVTAVDLRER